jgi:hypothetical protein
MYEHLTRGKPSAAPDDSEGRIMSAETATLRYVIRYRFAGHPLALLVEDSAGEAYVVGTAGSIRPLAGLRDLARLEPSLRRLGWVPVPRVASYRVDELRNLLVS